MLVSLKELTGCEDYYIDDTTFQIVSFKQKKYTEGKILIPNIRKDGYIQYRFNINGKRKCILLHHIIVKLFINKNFDSSKFDIDHKDHNRTNNSIDNLCIVSHIENCRNMSSMNGIKFNYIDDIGNALVINKEAQIYYSLDLDKFYMYINHTNKYRELHEHLSDKYPFLQYCYNNKDHIFRTTNFRRNLNKQEQ